MRRVISLVGLLVLIAGCTTGAGGAPGSTASSSAPTTAAAPTVAPTAVPKPAPTWSTVSARLTFDGKTCTYTGPTVVTAPATLMLEYAPTKESYALNFGMVASTATLADIKAVDADSSYGPAPGKKVPAWLLDTTWHAFWGSGTATYDLGVLNTGTKTYDQALVSCVRNEWTDDQPADTVEGRVTGALIKVLLPTK